MGTEPYELTLSFDTFGDMVKAMRKIKHLDVDRNSLVHGFTGRVMVVLGDKILAALPEYAREKYEASLSDTVRCLDVPYIQPQEVF